MPLFFGDRHSIQDEGIGQADEPALNFIGSGVTVQPDADRLNINVPGLSVGGLFNARYLTNPTFQFVTLASFDFMMVDPVSGNPVIMQLPVSPVSGDICGFVVMKDFAPSPVQLQITSGSGQKLQSQFDVSVFDDFFVGNAGVDKSNFGFRSFSWMYNQETSVWYNYTQTGYVEPRPLSLFQIGAGSNLFAVTTTFYNIEIDPASNITFAIQDATPLRSDSFEIKINSLNGAGDVVLNQSAGSPFAFQDPDSGLFVTTKTFTASHNFTHLRYIFDSFPPGQWVLAG